MPTPADWQLPPGVSREVWDYLHDSSIARRYDEALAGTPLLEIDRRFVEKHCPMRCKVIDLGCGTGRVAIPLAQLGHAVTAVDLSADMLRIAGEKAAGASVRLDRVQANIVECDGFGDRSFDVALCLFATLSMVAGAAARRRVVGHAYRMLRPGGMFIIHVHARWHHLRTRAGRRWLFRDIFRFFANPAETGDWRMVHHDGQTGWTMHLFSRREVIGLLRSAGFAIAEVQAVGLGGDGQLRLPWLLGGLRAYGFLIAARKPDLTGGTGGATLS